MANGKKLVSSVNQDTRSLSLLQINCTCYLKTTCCAIHFFLLFYNSIPLPLDTGGRGEKKKPSSFTLLFLPSEQQRCVQNKNLE